MRLIDFIPQSWKRKITSFINWLSSFIPFWHKSRFEGAVTEFVKEQTQNPNMSETEIETYLKPEVFGISDNPEKMSEIDIRRGKLLRNTTVLSYLTRTNVSFAKNGDFVSDIDFKSKFEKIFYRLEGELKDYIDHDSEFESNEALKVAIKARRIPVRSEFARSQAQVLNLYHKSQGGVGPTPDKLEPKMTPLISKNALRWDTAIKRMYNDVAAKYSGKAGMEFLNDRYDLPYSNQDITKKKCLLVRDLSLKDYAPNSYVLFMSKKNIHYRGIIVKTDATGKFEKAIVLDAWWETNTDQLYKEELAKALGIKSANVAMVKFGIQSGSKYDYNCAAYAVNLLEGAAKLIVNESVKMEAFFAKEGFALQDEKQIQGELQKQTKIYFDGNQAKPTSEVSLSHAKKRWELSSKWLKDKFGFSPQNHER